MSIASPTDADYTTTINTLRGHIAKGTQPSAYEMRLALAVVKNAVARFTTSNTDAPAAAALVDAAIAAVVADIEVLDAAACAANAGADAAAVIVQAVTDLEAITAEDDVTAEAISLPTYVTSTVADG